MTTPSEMNKSDKYKQDKVFEVLKVLIPEGEIKEDAFYMERLGLAIEASVPYVNGALAQVTFVLKHDIFQEELIEAVIGAGVTFDEAVKQAAEVFTASVLDSVLKALEDRMEAELSISLPDKNNKFKLYKSSVLVQGSKCAGESTDLWLLLEEEIKRCIGNKRAYLIKVYAARTGEAVNCECRINGIIYPKLTQKLNELAEKWVAEDAVYAERQYFMLMQEEEGYKPYAFTKKEVESHAMKALLLFRECKSQEDYEKIYRELVEACGHESLAAELLMLIPEMFTEIIFSEVNYGDELMLVKGSERTHIYKHQLTAYDWIYSVVDRTIRAGYFTKEQVDPVILRSASLSSINDAVSKGSKRENLSVLGVALPVPPNYEVL